MEQPAHSRALSFDPVIDTPEWRRAQRERLLASVKELEAEHGPVDPEILAEIEAAAATWPE
jgi:hypothetical protein